MIEAAVAGGVRHFYPSEFGIDFDRDDVQQFRFFRDRIVTRDHLAATAKAHPDFRYTLMVVGQFSQWAYSKVCGIDVENHVVEAYGYPDAEISVTALEECVLVSKKKYPLPIDSILVSSGTPSSQFSFPSPRGNPAATSASAGTM
jgi:hypothetical protein